MELAETRFATTGGVFGAKPTGSMFQLADHGKRLSLRFSAVGKLVYNRRAVDLSRLLSWTIRAPFRSGTHEVHDKRRVTGIRTLCIFSGAITI